MDQTEINLIHARAAAFRAGYDAGFHNSSFDYHGPFTEAWKAGVALGQKEAGAR